MSGFPTELFGYEVLSQLGEGAASRVYVVSEPKSGQLYAMKHVVRTDEKSQRYFDQLANELAVSQKIGANANVRFVKELKTSKTLLGKVTEAGLVLELVDAVPLARLLEEDGIGDLNRTVGILAQAAKGMAAIKAAGFVHADMKPENIMVLSDGSVKVIDLGQACPLGTVKDRVQGSPNYISPEQLRLEKITFRTDVFNFGATMYWALTGKFVPTEYMRKKGKVHGKSDDAPSPMELNPAVPVELSKLVMESVRTKIMERPDSMQTVAARLEAIRRGMEAGAGPAAGATPTGDMGGSGASGEISGGMSAVA